MRRMTPEKAMSYLGVQADGRLSPCPKLKNCVCSHYPSDQGHHMEGILFQGSLAEAKLRLQKIIAKFPEAKLVADQGSYLRAEFTSPVFKFVDDVEFLIKVDEGMIHFRSASRLGQWDLGANRKRLRKIRNLFVEGL